MAAFVPGLPLGLRQRVDLALYFGHKAFPGDDPFIRLRPSLIPPRPRAPSGR